VQRTCDPAPLRAALCVAAVCCSVLQCVAVCCSSVLQCTQLLCELLDLDSLFSLAPNLPCKINDLLQHTATCCCNTLQHIYIADTRCCRYAFPDVSCTSIATHCNTLLQHTATCLYCRHQMLQVRILKRHLISNIK